MLASNLSGTRNTMGKQYRCGGDEMSAVLTGIGDGQVMGTSSDQIVHLNMCHLLYFCLPQ